MHIFHILPLVLFCTSVTCLETSPCGRRKEKEMSKTKCVAGRRFFARLDKIPSFTRMFPKQTLIQPYTYPWLARVVATYAGKRATCTGTLINDRYIITAQHCVLPPLEPQHLLVTLGYPTSGSSQSLDASAPPSFTQHKVITIILHPGYDFTNVQTSANDIALLKIQPVKYSKTIYPIELPGIADRFYSLVNAVAENAGWQVPLLSREGQSIFQKMPVRVISNDVCSNFNVYYKYAINPGLLCSVNLGYDNQGICTSVTGAPLMVEDNKRVYNVTILVGIVSWSSPRNKPCAWFGSPAVYVRIDNKLEWIAENTKDALYCRY